MGYTDAELQGQTPAIHLDGPTFARVHEDLSRSGRFVGEVRSQHKDGVVHDLELSVFTLRTPKDELLYYVGVERDITARKQLERQLRQTQNLETVGRLAAGIAHDFNNLLTVITGYSQLTLSELATDDPWHDIMTQIDRAAALTQQLMNFSQQQEVHATAVDLNTVVTDAERLLRQRLGEPITLTTILARDLGLVLANPHQLGQVIMNLASNARDAMPQGGTLTIETASVEPSASMDPASSSRSLVRLIVQDTGCGMAAETRDRIFEPFFTTKRVEEVGKGYGLGLAVVHGIITQSGGTIEVDSELGRGTTTITIDLPRIAAQRQTRRPAPSLLARRAGTILLVEDDAALRTMVRVVLQKQGYTVLEAGDGIQALAVADQHPTIHLLVTDMVMPGMGGKAVAERLVAQRSGLKVLFMPGYPGDSLSQQGALAAGAAFLHKPFTLEALTRTVQAVLDAPQGGLR